MSDNKNDMNNDNMDLKKDVDLMDSRPLNMKTLNRIVLEPSDEKRLLSIAALISVLFYVLFYKKLNGINYFLFYTAFTAFIWKFLKVEKTRLNIAVSSAIVVLSSYMFFRDNLFLRTLNGMLVPLLLSVLFLMNSNKRFDIEKPLTYTKVIGSFFAPFGFMTRPFEEIFRMAKSMLKDRKVSGEKYANIRKIMIGLLVSLPFVAIILGLLSSADMVFDSMLSSIPDFLLDIDLPSLPFDVFHIIFGFIYFYGLFFYFKYHKRNVETVDSKFDVKMDSLILSTVLTVINLIYVFFCFIQFKYLFFGDASSLPEGIGYADYARSGFFELVFLTVINMTISLFTLRMIEREKQNAFLKSMLYVVNCANLVMIYSAFFRMKLYENAYGHTRLRLFVFTFLAYELIVLAFNIIYIRKEEFKVLENTFILGLVIYMGLNVANVDSFIFNSNYEKFLAGESNGRFDSSYNVFDLSLDSFSNVESLLESEHAVIQERAIRHIVEVYDDFKHDTYGNDVREFNISRYLAAKKSYELIHDSKFRALMKKFDIEYPYAD